jgi:hypothetical protein
MTVEADLQVGLSGKTIRERCEITGSAASELSAAGDPNPDFCPR